MRRSPVLILTMILLCGTVSSSGADSLRVVDLPQQYQEWLDEVTPLITAEERQAFLEIREDYQRDAFIREFWKARDPRPETAYNELKGQYYARLEEARERFRDFQDERAPIYLIHGEPGSVFETDCGILTWPLEFWTYAYSPVAGRGFTVLFYQPAAGGPFKIWRPAEGYGPLLALPMGSRSFQAAMLDYCTEVYDDILAILEKIRQIESAGPFGEVGVEEPTPADPEWLESFRAFSTSVPESAEPLPASLDVRFTGQHQSRTIVEGMIRLEASEAGLAELGPVGSANLLLTGEVLREGELFDSFRYRYDLPRQSLPRGEIPLLFERYLRPGEYELILKLEDLNSGRVFHARRGLEVPNLARARAEAGASPLEGLEVPSPGELTAAGEGTSVRLVQGHEELRSGYVRFDAAVTGGETARVTFLLDDRPVLTKTRPPYSVELNLGILPESHTVRAVAYDEEGAELATDEVVLNPGRHSFRVRLVEPRSGGSYSGRMRVRAEVEAAEGTPVERLELFLNEEPVATLYQPPWTHPVEAPPSGELAFVRAVAYLADGNSTEDLVVINAPGYSEEVQVRMVELFATVLDASGRPLLDLRKESFRVLEDGVEQEILRFERMDDLPIHAALLVDTSASMADNLDAVREAALRFFEQTIRPRDRAALVTFSERPRLATDFTNEVERLAGGLGGLRAERSTAFFDSLVYALYNFQGLKGQRALLVLSDGKDRRSEYSFENALDYARSTGVTVYSIGLAVKGPSRGQLATLAEETGGRAFFIKDVEELDAIYETIQRDLRSRYLLAYQPPAGEGDGFRAIEVRVDRPGTEVRTLRGYFP